MDRIEQHSLNNSLIITGLDAENQNKERIICFAREILGVTILPEEITAVIHLGVNRDGYSLTKVAFIHSEAKIRMYHAGVSLRVNRHGTLWLNEELTKP